MKRLAMLSVLALSAIFLVVGCGGGDGSQAEQDHAPQKSDSSAKLYLRPENEPGVSGTVTFKNISDGIIVNLHLRDLPKPNTFYLAHIHLGSCAQGEQEEEEGEAHEHGGGAEIEYLLSQVKSDSQRGGSSTTTLGDTSVEKLFSGDPKYVNVHAAGSGNPPILSCADLTEAG